MVENAYIYTISPDKSRGQSVPGQVAEVRGSNNEITRVDTNGIMFISPSSSLLE